MENDLEKNESLYDLTEKNPDRSLNLAIILRALLDLSKPKVDNETVETSLLRDQANAWVFASIGVTCENFVYTCELAGVDPKTVRTFAIKAVTAKDNSDIRKKLNSFL
tara:strand:- start:1229 stop:1552 length:324 start_codon:yes stop_codon:yes gene_type:complete